MVCFLVQLVRWGYGDGFRELAGGGGGESGRGLQESMEVEVDESARYSPSAWVGRVSVIMQTKMGTLG